MDLPKLTYTKEEAAEMLNVPKGTINWLLRKGALPKRRIGKHDRFTLADLLEYVERAKVEK